jgi:uncharacterized protein
LSGVLFLATGLKCHYYNFMEFIWDKRKATSNQKKHGVAFADAATIFGDPMSFTFPDAEHSTDEERFITIGQSEAGRVILVAHTDRSGVIRIISARRTTRLERKYYEENK